MITFFSKIWRSEEHWKSMNIERLSNPLGQMWKHENHYCFSWLTKVFVQGVVAVGGVAWFKLPLVKIVHICVYIHDVVVGSNNENEFGCTLLDDDLTISWKASSVVSCTVAQLGLFPRAVVNGWECCSKWLKVQLTRMIRPKKII